MSIRLPLKLSVVVLALVWVGTAHAMQAPPGYGYTSQHQYQPSINPCLYMACPTPTPEASPSPSPSPSVSPSPSPSAEPSDDPTVITDDGNNQPGVTSQNPSVSTDTSDHTVHTPSGLTMSEGCSLQLGAEMGHGLLFPLLGFALVIGFFSLAKSKR